WILKRRTDNHVGQVTYALTVLNREPGYIDRPLPIGRLPAARHAKREAVEALRRGHADQARARARREVRRVVRPQCHTGRQRAGQDRPGVAAVAAGRAERDLDLADAARAEVRPL